MNRRDFLKSASGLGYLIPSLINAQDKPQNYDQVKFTLSEKDNKIGIYVTSPKIIDGIEVIIEAEPGRFTKIGNLITGEPRMDYSANLVLNTPFGEGGTNKDLIKCVGYNAQFTDEGRVEMENWPITEFSRFYELKIERKPGTFKPNIYATAISNNEILPVLVDSHVGDITKVEKVADERGIFLFGNNPNPANESTTITYNAIKPCAAKLYIYDINGRKVETKEQKSNQGRNYFHVDLNKYSSGAYLYSLEIDGKVFNKKFMVIK
ncbi:T9SS type A sorting domain-containing protein [bacterium]|nr:T9SS type A sorting domain-containing protein [bacterium]